MAKKINIPSFLRFTFLVWVKSVALILLSIFIYGLTYHEIPLEETFIGNIPSIILVVYLYTIPFFLIMLAVVYFINRTKWPIANQKAMIATIYALPFLGLAIYLLSSMFKWNDDNMEVVLFFAALIIIPAVMVYFTKLLPTNGQLIPEEKRDDIIDDISFEE